MMKHLVIYNCTYEGDTVRFTREMTQKDLAKLLARDDIELISVNDTQPTYRRKRKK